MKVFDPAELGKLYHPRPRSSKEDNGPRYITYLASLSTSTQSKGRVYGAIPFSYCDLWKYLTLKS